MLTSKTVPEKTDMEKEIDDRVGSSRNYRVDQGQMSKKGMDFTGAAKKKAASFPGPKKLTELKEIWTPKSF